MTTFHDISIHAQILSPWLFCDDSYDRPSSSEEDMDGNIDMESLLEEALELGWVDLKNKGHISEEE